MVKIKIIFQYLLALLPTIITVGGWQASLWAYGHFECKGGLKNLEPCLVNGLDIVPILGMGLFWCQILSFICVPISVYLLINVISKQVSKQK